MVSKEQKAQLISEFGKNEKDTGNVKAQIAILTEDITNLTVHLQKHKKDIVTRRSLLKKVARRNKYLRYLEKENYDEYRALISKLHLRK